MLDEQRVKDAWGAARLFEPGDVVRQIRSRGQHMIIRGFVQSKARGRCAVCLDQRTGGERTIPLDALQKVHRPPDRPT